MRCIFWKSLVRTLFQTLFAAVFTSLMATQAWADVRIGEYQCGGERMWVNHCAESCAIAFPDRPKLRGMTVESAENAQALEARLRGCRYLGGFGYSDASTAPQHPFGNDQSGSAPAMNGVVAGSSRGSSGENSSLKACLSRVGRDPRFASLVGKVDLTGMGSPPRASLQLSSRANRREAEALLRWLAKRQGCESRQQGPGEAWEQAEANLAGFTDEGIQLLATARITYGAFNQAVVRKASAVRRLAAAANPASKPKSSASFNGPAASSVVCGITDYRCSWRKDHPWAPANEQPYAPPAVPGASQENPWNKRPGDAQDNPWNQQPGKE